MLNSQIIKHYTELNEGSVSHIHLQISPKPLRLKYANKYTTRRVSKGGRFVAFENAGQRTERKCKNILKKCN